MISLFDVVVVGGAYLVLGRSGMHGAVFGLILGELIRRPYLWLPW